MEQKEISQAVIGRLPRYFRYLGELKDEGIERISSQELSDIMKVTASQIRQDFNNFGGFGQQGILKEEDFFLRGFLIITLRCLGKRSGIWK